MPRLIDRIDLAGKILTVDAMSMQKDIIDRSRRRSIRSARNLDTVQRIVLSVFSIWKRLHKKRADRREGVAEIMRHVSASFTKLIRFLCQK